MVTSRVKQKCQEPTRQRRHIAGDFLLHSMFDDQPPKYGVA